MQAGTSLLPSAAGVLEVRTLRKLGFVRGKHYTEYVSQVEALKREGRLGDAEKLLLELIDAVEEEARAQGPGWEIAPWYYQQLAIIYRKQKNYVAEINILERYIKLTGLKDGKFVDRLKKAQYLLQRVQDKTTSRGEPCPYCGETILSLPERRKKCPHCGKVVYVKPDQGFFPKSLLTEDEAWAVEKLKPLQRYGVTTEMFQEAWHAQEKMVESSGIKMSKRVFFGDVLWSVYNRVVHKLMQSKDELITYASLSDVYRHMALHFHEEGKDPQRLLMTSHEMALRALLASWGPDCWVEIVAREGACPECQAQHGKKTKAADALEIMPLPAKGCTHTEGKNLHPLCRCYYRAAPEWEAPPRRWWARFVRRRAVPPSN